MQSALIPVLIAALSPLCHADLVKLASGGTLSGDVMAIKRDGSLVMAVPMAKKPLHIRSSHTKHISFLSNQSAFHDHDALFTLVNGDRLSGDLISIDADHVIAKTSFSEQLEIPRQTIHSIKTSIRPRALVYPDLLDKKLWTAMENWTIENEALVATDRGHASCKLEDLPSSFSLAFDLKWETNPNFKLYFCSDDQSPRRQNQNRYYLQFARAGFEIKRESEGKNPYSSIGIVNRKPSDFPKNQVHIELRVDRKEKKILLFLNGELQGQYNDPENPSPSGNFLIFSNNDRNTKHISVSNIEVREWDIMTERHHNEDRGIAEVDSLIDHEGQRFGGKLVKTIQADKKQVVLFQSPHYPEALEIPSDLISTIFLQTKTHEPSPTPWSLEISESEKLSLQDVTLSSTDLNGTHPLLGEITIPNFSLKSLTHTAPGKEKP